MSNFISKLWKMNGFLFFLILFIAVTFASFPEMIMTLNGISSFSSINLFPIDIAGTMPISLRVSTPMGIFYILVSGLVAALLTLLFIRISVSIFGLVYARSYGRFATVNELPIEKDGLRKLMILYAIVCDVLLGLVRLIYFFAPIAYSIVELIVKPLIFGIIFFPFFFLIRKYFLEGRVSYNVLLALAIPFFIFLLLFC